MIQGCHCYSVILQTCLLRKKLNYTSNRKHFFKGISETPNIINLPAEVQSDEVALKWTEPISNGADITQYTVYTRNVSSNGTAGDWRKLEVIHDVSVREYVITLKKGQQYEFVVTATNKYGESLKEQQNIKRIRVLGGNVMGNFFLLFLFIKKEGPAV